MVSCHASSTHNRRRGVAIAAAAVLALSFSALSPATAADGRVSKAVEMTPTLEAQIEQMVLSFQSDNGLPGVSVAVVTPSPNSDEPVVTTFTVGYADLDSSTPVDVSTQFELGSETKAFTADLLAYLVASQQVSLDDSVQSYAPAGVVVPEWTDPHTGIATAITLRDLATHQSGLRYLPPNFNEGCGSDPGCVNPRPGYTQTLLWDAFALQPTLLWQPGTNWLYSNWGFSLLGTILSNVVDLMPETQPPAYQSALDGVFLADLGMSSTLLETPTPNLATPYGDDGTPTWHWNNTNAMSGAGGLISDATDMGTWVAAHLGYAGSTAPLGVQTMADTLQPVSTVTTVCSKTLECKPANFHMGLAWELHSATTQHVGSPWAFKNGDTAGFSTDTALAPSLSTGVTTMFNKKRVGTEQIAIPILKLLVHHQTSLEPAPVEQTGSPVPHPIAATGYEASTLLALGLGAAMLVVVGAALSASRREEGAARQRRS